MAIYITSSALTFRGQTEGKGSGRVKNIPLKDLKWLHIFFFLYLFFKSNILSWCIHCYCIHPPIHTPDIFFTWVANFLWQSTLDILMPENKVLAIKPINLGAAPEPTSGPIVLVDLCLTVDLGVGGYRGFELSFSILLPSLPTSQTHTHTLVPGPHGPDVSWFCCVVSFCYK